MLPPQQNTVDFLILGAGWTSTFLVPLLTAPPYSLTYAATSRSGSNSTISFTFDQEEEDAEKEEANFRKLPDAKTVLITFPITKKGAVKRLVGTYRRTRSWFTDNGLERCEVRWIQLGSTGVWDGVRKTATTTSDGKTTASPTKSNSHTWYTRHSPLGIPLSPRAICENEFLSLNPSSTGDLTTVLNLSGLWGGERQPRRWVGRVAPTKEALKNKGSLHLIHGTDVARGILAIHSGFDKTAGERWLLTDGRVYDWWDLASAWSTSSDSLSEQGPQATWVRELMHEEGVRALPRNIELLGRALDGREFWDTFQLTPIMGRVV